MRAEGWRGGTSSPDNRNQTQEHFSLSTETETTETQASAIQMPPAEITLADISRQLKFISVLLSAIILFLYLILLKA